ncbi:MAG: hypothetical protein R3F34_01420 [Planctomycetota bacterium]
MIGALLLAAAPAFPLSSTAEPVATDGARATATLVFGDQALVRGDDSSATFRRVGPRGEPLLEGAPRTTSEEARLAAALRGVLRRETATLDGAGAQALLGRTRLVGARTLPADDAGEIERWSSADVPSHASLWFRAAVDPGTRYFVPCAPTSDAAGASVALGPAFSPDAQDLAAWIVGLELLATHEAELWERVRAHTSRAGRACAPGELRGDSPEELVALADDVAAIGFDDDAIAECCTASFDGTTLRTHASLDAAALAEALLQCGASPDDVGRAALALEPAAFRALFAAQWDASAFVVGRVLATAPEDGVDLSRSAFERSTEAGRAKAEALLRAAGGAER